MLVNPKHKVIFRVNEAAAHLACRLGLQDVADLPLRLSVLPNTQKRRAAVPGYLPEEVSSLQYILRNCVDIREVPKKVCSLPLLQCHLNI